MNNIEFHSLFELNQFLAENEHLCLQKVKGISNDQHLFLYYQRQNKILYFDYKKDKGKFYSYEEIIPISKEIGVNIRNELSKLIGGIQFSRNNYLDLYKELSNLNLDVMDSIYNEVSNILPLSEGELKEDDLEKMNSFLGKITIEERMKYEIPLVMLFMKYGIEKYNANYKIRYIKNQFDEEICSITLICNSVTVNLSNHIFDMLYTHDSNKSLVDKNEFTNIRLQKVKYTIDAFYRTNFIFIDGN